MKFEPVFFDEITLLITHYNRSSSLARLLQSLEDQQIRFSEIIVSDDGSNAEHRQRLDQLKEYYPFKLIHSPRNKGLGNNINKGQQAVRSPFTLYVQEDFIPMEQFRNRLTQAVEIMKESSKTDIIRFYAYRQHPYLKPVKYGFCEMEFHFWRPNYWQFYCYSDHPHLRRSNFLEKFGQYAEGKHVEKTEYQMVIKFLQKKGKALIHTNYNDIFVQRNSSTEPCSTRNTFRKFRQRSNLFFIKLLRVTYRHLKFRFDYVFSGSLYA